MGEAGDLPRVMTENIVWGNVLFQKSSELGSQENMPKSVHLIFFF